MKHVKKLLGLLLALTLSLTLCLPAFAVSGTNNNGGSITINDAVKGHTYSIYQVMVLESYDTDKKAMRIRRTVTGQVGWRPDPVCEHRRPGVYYLGWQNG